MAFEYFVSPISFANSLFLSLCLFARAVLIYTKEGVHTYTYLYVGIFRARAIPLRMRRFVLTVRGVCVCVRDDIYQ